MDMDSYLKLSVARLSVNRLDLAQQLILDHLLSLLNDRTGVSKIENFSYLLLSQLMILKFILYLLLLCVFIIMVII